ncbi:MAG: sortase [Clostridiales bacterium]|nr:sortase [Clostridiales bacterium]
MKGAAKYLILAMCCLLAALALTMYNVQEADTAGEQAETRLKQLQLAEAQDLGNDTEEKAGLMPTLLVNGQAYIGELIISSCQMVLPVMADWDDEKLRMAPCRYRGSVGGRNMIIIGHNYNTHFGPLLTLPQESRVVFRDVKGVSHSYQAERTEILQGGEGDRLVEAGDWDLSLVTCTLSGYTRCVVRCKQVGSGAGQ